MSKSTSLKGYAVGALVALVSSLFMVAPAAQADANGPVTLLPTAGTTFNTVIGSPISLVSVQDSSTRTEADLQAASDNTYYIINNPAAAAITIGLVATPNGANSSFSYLTYDADGDYAAAGTATALPSIVVSAPGAAMTIKTTESKIAVLAANGAVAGLNTITLDAVLDTETVTLTVQTLVDSSKTVTGAADSFDRASNTETVVLYSPGAVTATTTINTLVPTGTSFKASVVYGNSVNPYFVAANTKVSVFKQGTVVALSASSPAVVSNQVQGYITSSAVVSQSKGVITFGYSGSDLVTPLVVLDANTALTAWDASVYSAQSYYKNSAGAFVTVGAASAVANVSAGTVALAGVSVSHTVTTDTAFSSPTITARSGTKAVTLNAQIRSASANLAAANAELKAVLTVNKLAAGSSVTITGAATALVAGGSAVTAYGRTDTDGKASFTITSNNGTKADSVNVHIFVKNTAGVWVSETSATGNDIVWANAAFSSFAASPVDYVSGANPTVTFKVKDQFGGPLDAISSKPLSVYAVASFGGVADATKYAATANVVGGAATFTFANFAATGGLAQLNASLLYGGTTFTVATVAQVDTVNVYNTAVSSEIAVVESFNTAVTYVDYVTGDTDEAAVATAVAAAGLDLVSGATIAGSVLNTAGAGQPGVAVTVAADGILFLSNGVYTLGTVTAAANEFGAFSVTAFAHAVHAKGTTVTITSDGLSATTLLVTYLPSSLDDADLDLSWVVPANVVKNTTYAIVVTLADKWGNPVAATTTSTNAVSILGAGSVEVNSVATAAKRNFDKNGQVTVFMRSVKDVAGPGSLTATLATGTGAWVYPTGVTGAAAGTTTAVGTFNVSDKKSTAWDESAWSNALSVEVEVLDSAADITTDTKVNAGSFKGYVAIYAKGYEGQRLSAKVGKDWVVIPALGSNFERVVELVGPGVDVTVRIYIDRVLVDTISLTTK